MRRADLGRHNLRAFAIDEIAGLGLNAQRHLARKNELVLVEDRGHASQPCFPCRGVQRIRCGRFSVLAGFLLREIWCGIVVLNFRGHVRAHARERFARLLIAAVRCPPQRLSDRPFVVGEREAHQHEPGRLGSRVAPHRARVVQRVIADADFDGGRALAAVVAAFDGAKCRHDLCGVRIVERIRPVIGRHRLPREHVHVALQFCLEDVRDRGLAALRRDLLHTQNAAGTSRCGEA